MFIYLVIAMASSRKNCSTGNVCPEGDIVLLINEGDNISVMSIIGE